MWMVIGALCGVLLGLGLDDAYAAAALGLFGGLIGWARDTHDRKRGAAGAVPTSGPATPEATTRAIIARLAEVESRLARIERAMRLETQPTTIPEPIPPAPPEAAASNAPPPRPAYGAAGGSTAPTGIGLPAAESAEAVQAKGSPSAVREWLTGGNALTRVGIVILFFGVAFLLRHFAELATVPIEAKLGAAALGGLALAALGARLARQRPAYGLSLQGAGMGIVYLTVFAAFRLYEALAPLPAIVLLVAVAAATIALALRHDAQALAALALAGGFAAPVLIETGSQSPALLFGWFAVLNAAVFAIAWRRSWRALNVLGFVFTFALGLTWGWWFYRPAHFGVVQPFLALFFLFYVGIAILYARNAPSDAAAPVDGVLVFGVPLVGFALQVGIVRDVHFGAAWSAGVLAAFYAGLWLLLRARGAPGLSRLSKAFAALAVVFATLVVPLALDARWTSAGWAIEAAAVYWLGVVQRQRVARWFAIAVEVAAALAFVWESPAPGGWLLANAAFVGMALTGLAALVFVFVADRHPEALGEGERGTLWPLFVWGSAWWTVAGVVDFSRLDGGPRELNAMIAWVVGTAALALVVSRVLRWKRLSWLFVVVLPALCVGGSLLLDAHRTTLGGGGWLVWPLAWLVHAAGMRTADTLVAEDVPQARARLHDLHAVSAVALVAWLAWEAGEWTGRATAEGTVWIACATALPAAAMLAVVTDTRTAAGWPLRDHAAAYGRSAGTLLAAALALWFVGVNAISPGDPHPLPYVPLANPLDATLAAALAVLWHWSGAWGRLSIGQRVAAGAAALFVALNGALVRTAHHWGGVAWNADTLFAYRPLQVTLTLAWTTCALALMLLSTRRGIREVWLAGAGLLALVVAKLFLVDLAALSGLARVIAFLGTGALLLVIGYVAPLPPARSGK